MLTGNEIAIRHSIGDIVIEPFDPTCIGPNSYDVHLGDKLVVYTEVILDPKKENRTTVIPIPEKGYILQPGILYLASTVEYTENPFHVPGYDGRSSLGRLGVFSHATAGFGDIGFIGRWTLEISVVQPVRVYAGMKIGQLFWHCPEGEITKRYTGKYQGSEDVMASKLWQDFQMGEKSAPIEEPKQQNPNTKECPVCGGKFVTTRGNRKYCSEECRIAAGYAPTKAKKRSLTPICLRSVKICPACCL